MRGACLFFLLFFAGGAAFAQPDTPSHLTLSTAATDMSVALTHKTDGTATSEPVTTASITWTSGARGYVTVAIAHSAVAGMSESPTGIECTVTGGGVTWTKLIEHGYRLRRALFIFESSGTPADGTLEIDVTALFGGSTLAEIHYSVEEATGLDGTTPSGTPVGANVASGSTTLALASVGAIESGDVVLTAGGHEVASNAFALTSHTTLSDRQTGSNVRALVVGYQSSDDTPNSTWSSSSGGTGMVAVLLKAASGGGGGGEALTASFSDALSLGDSTTRSMSMGRAMADTVSLGDSMDRSAALARALADAVALGESTARAMGLDRAIADTVALGDSVSRSAAFARALTDAISLGDSTSAAIVIVRSFSDALSLGDTFSRQLALSRALAEALILAEQFGGSQALARALTDALSLGDSISGTVIPPDGDLIVRALSDAIALGDSTSASAVLVRALSDAIALADSTTTAAVFVRLVSDGISIADAVQTSALLVRAFGDQIALTDQLWGYLGGLDVPALRGVIESLRLRATIADQRLRGTIAQN